MTRQQAINYLRSSGFSRLQIDTVEKAFRPSGEWIYWTDDRKDYVKCSNCDYGEEGEVKYDEQTPYCPVCGSHNPITDMRR